jgi:hypothetical protein
MLRKLKEISELYGEEIKMIVKWYFENPVGLMPPSFGKISEPSKDSIYQGEDDEFWSE